MTFQLSRIYIFPFFSIFDNMQIDGNKVCKFLSTNYRNKYVPSCISVTFQEICCVFTGHLLVCTLRLYVRVIKDATMKANI